MSKWFYKNKKIDRELSNKLGIHPAIIKILADRGVETEEDIREFLAADLSKVSDGSELTDMEKGVSIIQDAIAAGKHIRIIGDYDVDGVTSTYILYKGLIGLHKVHDYITYSAAEEELMEQYRKNIGKVKENLKRMLPEIGLTGQWSMDIMQNGNDFYLIDMALAENSALKECVPKSLLKKVEEDWIPRINTKED